MLLYVPTGQEMQAAEPGLLMYDPAGQGKHLVDSGPENEPASQISAAIDPGTDELYPGVEGLHDDCPFSLLKVPAGHFWHTDSNSTEK